MALADGYYTILGSRISATLAADTGSGGLFETATPTCGTPVQKLPDESEFGLNQPKPVIYYLIDSKSESVVTGFIRRLSFNVRIEVYERDADRTTARALIQKIMARIETVMREQATKDYSFGGISYFTGAENVHDVQCTSTVISDGKILGNTVGWIVGGHADFQIDIDYCFN